MYLSYFALGNESHACLLIQSVIYGSIPRQEKVERHMRTFFQYAKANKWRRLTSGLSRNLSKFARAEYLEPQQFKQRHAFVPPHQKGIQCVCVAIPFGTEKIIHYTRTIPPITCLTGGSVFPLSNVPVFSSLPIISDKSSDSVKKLQTFILSGERTLFRH